jgi:hypothetical protein
MTHETMPAEPYPRSPKVLLGGIAHLARFIDKVRLRHAGQIQDYNYITTGFDKHLLAFLRVEPEALERRILQGGTDDALLEWVRRHSRALSAEDIRQWSQWLLASGPKDEEARNRFRTRLAEVAAKRGVPIDSLPPVTTWADIIEMDEERQ